MNALNEQNAGQASISEGVIEVHLRELRQLFDAMDPAPFHEKDLDPAAAEYITDSFDELPGRSPGSLVIHLDEPTNLPQESEEVGEAVRAHFERQAGLRRRGLRRLVRRGLISLIIGVVFLVTLFALAQFVSGLLGGGATAMLAREGLMIGGWVAMWRPLEIFLYDWWPLVGEIRMHDRLSRIEIRVVHDIRPAKG